MVKVVIRAYDNAYTLHVGMMRMKSNSLLVAMRCTSMSVLWNESLHLLPWVAQIWAKVNHYTIRVPQNATILEYGESLSAISILLLWCKMPDESTNCCEVQLYDEYAIMNDAID